MKTYLSVVFIGLLLLSLSYSSRSKESILDLPTEVKRYSAVLLPQGWAFFTKSARDPVFETYKLDEEGNPSEKISINNVDKKNLFGISRYSRRLSYESSIMISEGTNLDWKKIKGDTFPVVSSIPVSHVFNENNAVKNLESGKYIISRSEPIPWSWHADFNKENTRKEYVVIDFVNCES